MAHRWLAARPCGLSEPAARRAPVTVVSGRSPSSAHPAGARRGRELERSLGIWRKQSAGSGRGRGRAAMKSEAQQRLQLNQFGDKNSACRPCLCSDFIKVSAALERKPACVSLPPLQTGERSKIATTTETLFSFIVSPFLSVFLSPTLSPRAPRSAAWLTCSYWIIRDRHKEMRSPEAERDRASRYS